MAKFIRKQFQRGEYLIYEGKFVARHKIQRSKVQPHFIKFLVNNFETEEYFALLATGLAPVQVLHTKGYKSYFEEQIEKERK